VIRTSNDDEPRETCRIAATGEPLGEILELTAGAGLRGFLVHHERLPPRRRASSPHAHSHKEEFVYVLRGSPTLYLDGQPTRLRPNDAVSFAASTGLLHFLANETDDTVEYLVVSTPADADVVTYGPPGSERAFTR